MSNIEDYIGKEFLISGLLGNNKYKIDSIENSWVKVTWDVDGREDYTTFPISTVLRQFRNKA